MVVISWYWADTNYQTMAPDPQALLWLQSDPRLIILWKSDPACVIAINSVPTLGRPSLEPLRGFLERELDFISCSNKTAHNLLLLLQKILCPTVCYHGIGKLEVLYRCVSMLDKTYDSSINIILAGLRKRCIVKDCLSLTHNWIICRQWANKWRAFSGCKLQ